MADAFRILGVEDDADIAHLIKIALSLDKAVDARIARSGKEALRVMADDDWRPDCVLMDYHLTDTDAVKLIRDIRQLPAHTRTPAIVLTADPRALALMEIAGSLAGIIAKPFRPTELAATVRAMVARVSAV